MKILNEYFDKNDLTKTQQEKLEFLEFNLTMLDYELTYNLAFRGHYKGKWKFTIFKHVDSNKLSIRYVKENTIKRRENLTTEQVIDHLFYIL
ncbi:hypothetical protein D3C87_81080 [compost metagenome]